MPFKHEKVARPWSLVSILIAINNLYQMTDEVAHSFSFNVSIVLSKKKKMTTVNQDRVDLGVIAKKGYSIFPQSLSLIIRCSLVSYSEYAPFSFKREGLPLCRRYSQSILSLDDKVRKKTLPYWYIDKVQTLKIF